MPEIVALQYAHPVMLACTKIANCWDEHKWIAYDQ